MLISVCCQSTCILNFRTCGARFFRDLVPRVEIVPKDLLCTITRSTLPNHHYFLIISVKRHCPTFTGNSTTKCNYLVEETLIKSRVGEILLTLKVRTFLRFVTIFSYELEVPADTGGLTGRFPDVGLLPNWYVFLHVNEELHASLTDG